jgi:alkanesulfonate monooxygenase SsuD/methylene tetrahydromethanopterin reductase-like flavin-dependent oxidoreductase (luciferase family)
MSPFRFGLTCDAPDASPAEVARRAEDAGYSTVLFPDHLGLLAPFPAMVAAAAATDTVRVGTQVLNVAFRPVGLVAQEAATVDALSGGWNWASVPATPPTNYARSVSPSTRHPSGSRRWAPPSRCCGRRSAVRP